MKQMPFAFAVTAVLVLSIVGHAAPSLAGQTSSALEDARVQEVITMVMGGLSLELLLVKIDDIGSFPELSGSDLVALKNRGVPERALVRMVELEQAAPNPAPPAPAVPAAPVAPAIIPEGASAPRSVPAVSPASSAAIDADAAAIRVEVEKPFMITYFEIALDGEILAHKGKLWDGLSEPGQKIRRPQTIGRRSETHFTALETEVTPGRHEVAVGFAVTWVKDDSGDSDDWGQFAHEFYLNRGVRAVAAADDHPGDWFEAGSTTCDVEAGQTCVVKVVLEKTKPTALGGLPIYGVSYEVTAE